MFRPNRNSRLGIEFPALEDIALNDIDQEGEQTEPKTKNFSGLIHETAFVVVCAFAGATFAFLQRSTVILTESIKQELGMDQPQESWISSASGLTTGAFLLPMAFLVDNCRQYSRKTFLLSTLSAYCLFVGLAAVPMNGVFLDVVMALTGEACAAHIPSAVSILSSVYPTPSRRRNLAFAFFLAGGSPISIMLGGVASGLVAMRFTWRATFCFFGAIFVVVVVLGFLAMPNIPRLEDDRVQNDKRFSDLERLAKVPLNYTPEDLFDWVALLLLVTGVGLTTSGLTIAPGAGWSAPYVVLILIIGFLSLVCLVAWESTIENPMIPPIVWKNKNLALLILFNILTAMGAYSVIFWVPLFMQNRQALTPLEVAIKFIPQALVGLCVSPTVGLIMHRVNNTFILATAAFAQASSSLLLIFMRMTSSYWAFHFPALMLSTVSIDWALNVASHFIFSSLPLQQHAIGAAVAQTLTRLAVPVGLALTTAVHTSYKGAQYASTPELAYTNTFYAMLGFAIVNVLLVPFIRIGKQGVIQNPDSSSFIRQGGGPIQVTEISEYNFPKCDLTGSSGHPARGPRRSMDPVGRRRSSLYAKGHSQYLIDAKIGKLRPMPPLTEAARPPSCNVDQSRRSVRTKFAERLIWLVCEDCGASRRIIEQVGDPSRYFHDSEYPGPEDDRNQSSRQGSMGTPRTTIHQFPLTETRNGDPGRSNFKCLTAHG